MALHEPALSRPVNKWLVTVSVTFGTLMGAIDASIVNVAIPHIRGALGATIEEITWVTTGFVIATVLVMPLTAFLGRLYGQKRVYLSCLALFIAGSALCGLARSLTSLVLFRAIQGLGAGALQPTEQAILRQTFPREEQAMAMAVFGMAVMIGPAIGPTLGGYIVDHASWPWIFYINLPVGALGLVMVYRFVQEPEDIRTANRAAAEHLRQNIDYWGIILLSVGLVAMQYVLEEGERKDWFDSRLISGLSLLAVVSLTAFVLRELSAALPAVNLGLFRDRVFLSGTLIGSIMFSMLMASMFLLPLFMQELLGFTAMQSGLALMPRVLTMMVLTPVMGRLYGRVPPRALITFSILCYVAGSYQMSRFSLDAGWGDIVRASVIQGVGFSGLFVTLTTVALSDIPRRELTDATGLNSLLRQIGGSLGLAIFATLLTRYQVHARADIVSSLFAGRPELVTRLAQLQGAMSAAGLDPSSAKDAATQMLSLQIDRQALMLSFDRLFLLSGIVFLCVLPLVMLLKASKPPSAHVDTHIEM